MKQARKPHGFLKASHVLQRGSKKSIQEQIQDYVQQEPGEFKKGMESGMLSEIESIMAEFKDSALANSTMFKEMISGLRESIITTFNSEIIAEKTEVDASLEKILSGDKKDTSLTKLTDILSGKTKSPLKTLTDQLDEKKQNLLSKILRESKGRGLISKNLSLGETFKRHLKTSAATALGFGEEYKQSVEDEDIRKEKEQRYLETQGQLTGKDEETLKKEFAEREAIKEKIRDLEAEIEAIRETGDVSEDDIEKLDISKEKNALLGGLLKEEAPKQQKTESISTPLDLDLSAPGVTEEEQHEQAVVQEEMLSDQQNQTKVLIEIRDLLAGGAVSKGTTPAAAPADTGGGIGDFLGNMGLWEGAKRLGGKALDVGKGVASKTSAFLKGGSSTVNTAAKVASTGGKAALMGTIGTALTVADAIHVTAKKINDWEDQAKRSGMTDEEKKE